MAEDKQTVDGAVRFVIDNWEALGVTEHGGMLFLPATIKRRNAKGGIDETPIALRNVTNDHKFRCRKTARSYALDLGLDLDRDRVLIEDIENYAILAYAIRDAKPPHDQHVPGLSALLDLYTTQSLAEVWTRYNVWLDMLDPRFGELDAEQLWQTAVRIARERDPSPLVDMPGHAQATFIVLLASEACLSPRAPSWLRQPATSSAA